MLLLTTTIGRAARMQFTQGQLRSILGLSQETFRHWKKVLPPFADGRGHSPCFTTGDLLGAAIIRRLTDFGGLRVGRLGEISVKIVALCNTSSWTALEGDVLIVNLKSGACHLGKSKSEASISDITVVCPLTPIMTELRDTLLRSQTKDDQGRLLFPPTQIGHEAPPQRRAR